MPFIAAFFASAFGTLFSIFLRFFSVRISVAAALTAALLAASVVFYVFVQGLIVSVVSFVDNDLFLMYFYAMWPDNASTCITACLASDVGCYIYRHKVRLMTTIAQIG
jgi:hypothetical protein